MRGLSLTPLRDFYRAQGRFAECVQGTLWVGETRLSLMAVPGVLPVTLPREQVVGILRRSGRVAAIYSPPVATGVTVDAFLIRDRAYGWHSLQRQFRQQTRAALQQGEVRTIPWSELSHLGWPAHHDTMRRRGSADTVAGLRRRWSMTCAAAAAVEGLEAWGVVTKGAELAAAMLVWTQGGLSHGLQTVRTEHHRRLRPMHALFFEVARHRLRQQGVEAFSAGRQTMPPLSGVDRFKEHAGFVRESRPLAVVLRPGVAWCLGRPAVVHRLRQWRDRGLPGAGWLRNLEVLEAAAATRLEPGRV